MRLKITSSRVYRKKRRGGTASSGDPLLAVDNGRQNKKKHIIIWGLICITIFALFRWASKIQNGTTKSIMEIYNQVYYPPSPPSTTPESSSSSWATACTLDQSNLEHTRIYQHQNGLEEEETTVMKDNNRESSFCQDTNYLIIVPPSRGFGAMLRSVVSLIGLNFDNKTIIVHWPWGMGFMSGVYNASQCPNPNADSAWECFFEPVSKCTLQDALQVAGGEANGIGDIPFWYDAAKEARVVKVDKFSHYFDNSIPKDIYKNFRPNIPISQFGCSDPWQSQVTRYLLRFNPETRALLEPHMDYVHSSFKEKNIDSSRSIALMIRGSDKCNEDVSGKMEAHETDCLPLRSYLDAVQNVWRWDQRIKDVIVTSEDSRYIEAVKRFRDGPPPPGFELSSSSSSSKNETGGGSVGGGHKFTFHFNDQDIQQGSSLIANALEAGTITSHFDLIKSMWTTIEMAVQARYMILNCGSFFHQLAVVYRYSTCHGNGQSPPVIFCLDHLPKQNMSGFDLDTIKSGGSYKGRWEYQA